MFLLFVPFALLGSVTKLQLMPDIPISALGFVCPATAAAFLSFREGGRAALGALPSRSLEFKRIHSRVWLLPLLLPNFFDVSESARLASALPNTKSNALTPYFTPGRGWAEQSSLFRCEKCAGGKVMMTGKPSVILCRSCDDAKIRKRVLRWEEARLTPWAS